MIIKYTTKRLIINMKIKEMFTIVILILALSIFAGK